MLPRGAVCLMLCFVLGIGRINGFRLQRKSRQFEQSPLGIVGGSEATEGSIPWQVSIRTNEYDHFCGGSLVDTSDGNMAIVTAAHCTYAMKPSESKVVIGRHSLTTSSFIESTFQVRSVVMHPSYSNETYKNDIAILFVAETIKSNEFGISPIKMTDRDVSSFVGSQCLISGWGTLEEEGETPDKLQYAFVEALPDETCQQASQQSDVYKSYDPTNMICAGMEAGGIDTCQGDSGGPLACYNETEEEYLLVGVTSFGDGCARAGMPGVYADVYDLKWWLLRELGF